MSRYCEWKEYIESCLKENCENVEFIHFFALWNAYNYYYNEQYTLLPRDSCRAVEISFYYKLNLYYEEIKEEALSEFQSIPSFRNEEDVRTQVVDARFNDIDNSANALFNENKNTLINLLKAIYKIRCNLFHGDKTPYNSTDVKLVKWAYKYLSLILHQYDPDSFPEYKLI